jgi:hypothetical protein
MPALACDGAKKRCVYRREVDDAAVPMTARDAGQSNDASRPACSELDPVTCGQTPGCYVLTGLKYDASQRCRAQTTAAVGCMPLTQGCTGAITYASDLRGATWQFSSGCVPKGWLTFNPPQDVKPSAAWEACAAP